MSTLEFARINTRAHFTALYLTKFKSEHAIMTESFKAISEYPDDKPYIVMVATILFNNPKYFTHFKLFWSAWVAYNEISELP